MLHGTRIVGLSALSFLAAASFAQVRAFDFDDIPAGEIGDQYLSRGVRFLHGNGDYGTSTGPLVTEGVMHSAYVGSFGTSMSPPNVLIPTPGTNNDLWVYFYNSRGERSEVLMVGVCNDREAEPSRVYLDAFDADGTLLVRTPIEGSCTHGVAAFPGIFAVRISAGPGEHGKLGVDNFEFCAAPEITGEPSELQDCDHGVRSFGVGVFGEGVTYTWQVAGPDGEVWTDVADDGRLFIGGLSVGEVSGAGTERVWLRASGLDGDKCEGYIRVSVSNDCGAITTMPTPFRVCAGDYNCDGGIDGADIVGFFADWEGGVMESDLNRDGGIDGSDVVFFFARWENGC